MRSFSIGAALLAVVWGCGHSSAARPIPSTPAPAARSAPAPRGAERSVSSSSTAAAPVKVDPTEAITPRELASIPDPVPSADVGRGAIRAPAESDSEVRTDPSAANPSAETGGSASRSTESSDGRNWVWRVQLFASPDLEQANRVAKEASTRFGVPFVIEFEGTLYKVRLGAFGSESSAQALRERAVQEGFPGAFRMRSQEPVTSATK